MKIDFLRIAGIVGILLSIQSCGEVDLIELNDFDEQLQTDRRMIDDYISEKNLPNVDSTTSGIRYAIMDLGEGAEPVPNEFVSVDYYNQDLEGISYGSNIREVADTSVFVPINQAFEPIVFTYSQSGWTLDFVSFADRLVGDGLKEAIGAAFLEMKEGGHVMVFLPSSQAFGSNPEQGSPVPANTVLIYHIFLREVL